MYTIIILLGAACSYYYFHFDFRYVTLNIYIYIYYIIRVSTCNYNNKFILEFILSETKMVDFEP